MTPERKKYLANINEDERTIRQYIANLKTTISILKALCKEDKFAYALQRDKQEISKFKIIIKALKKQLPAQFWVSKSNTYYCPTCGHIADNGREYCSRCGQKLR